MWAQSQKPRAYHFLSGFGSQSEKQLRPANLQTWAYAIHNGVFSLIGPVSDMTYYSAVLFGLYCVVGHLHVQHVHMMQRCTLKDTTDVSVTVCRYVGQESLSQCKGDPIVRGNFMKTGHYWQQYHAMISCCSRTSSGSTLYTWRFESPKLLRLTHAMFFSYCGRVELSGAGWYSATWLGQ